MARETWFKVLRSLGWQQFTPSPNDGMVDWWLHTRKLVAKARLEGVRLLGMLSLWLERNGRVFDRKSSSVQALISCILNHTELWCRASLVDRSAILGE
jgi:hypothetical protein